MASACRFGAAALAVVAVGCADDPAGPREQPFGRIGDVTIRVVSPLNQGAGELNHVVEWSSDGPWKSTERIYYGGVLGDATILWSVGDVPSLARTYANWIDLVNDTPSVTLFNPLVSSDVPPCGGAMTARVPRV